VAVMNIDLELASSKGLAGDGSSLYRCWGIWSMDPNWSWRTLYPEV